MSQEELFDRVAECDRLMKLTSDSVIGNAFGSLRELWISLANESPAMTSEVLAKEVAALEQIQSALERQSGAS